MVTGKSFAEIFAAWASGQPAIKAVVHIGSHIRPPGSTNAADPASDWDFQVITSQLRIFADSSWTRGLSGAELRAYSVRPAFGGVQKVTALFAGAEADFVVLSAGQLRLARLALALGLHRRPGPARRGLADLAVVIRPGHRFLKGGAAWEKFYQRVILEVPDPRLGDDEIRTLADGFVCDVVWTLRKLERGECLASQRMLHQSLAETNFRLLHELRLRRSETSWPEARRLERVAASGELSGVTVSAEPAVASLTAAVAKSRATLENLMSALVPAWRWPALD